MKKDLSQFFNTFSDISPTDSEKQDMRENLIAQIETDSSSRVLSPWAPFPTIGVVASTFLVLFSGVWFGAESSLPGDVLYPIKTNVTEKVAQTLSFENTQVERLADLTSRRVAELESLAENNTLTASSSENLVNEISENTKEAAVALETEAGSSTKMVADQLSALLQTRADQLEELAQKDAAISSTTKQAATSLKKLASAFQASSTASFSKLAHKVSSSSSSTASTISQDTETATTAASTSNHAKKPVTSTTETSSLAASSSTAEAQSAHNRQILIQRLYEITDQLSEYEGDLNQQDLRILTEVVSYLGKGEYKAASQALSKQAMQLSDGDEFGLILEEQGEIASEYVAELCESKTESGISSIATENNSTPKNIIAKKIQDIMCALQGAGELKNQADDSEL